MNATLLAQRKQALSQSIEQLYEVFRNFKLSPTVCGCDHCVFPNDNELIHSKPLRKLTASDLGKYAHKALTTWGDEDDLRHFLPWLFELMIDEQQCDFIDHPILTGKLRYGKWDKWPAQQRQSIVHFLECYWLRIIAEYPCPIDPAESALCTIASALNDITKFLQLWLCDESLPGISHLIEFITNAVPEWLRRKELPDAFWQERQKQIEQVIQFLRSQELRIHIERLFFSYEKNKPEFAAEISSASGFLEILGNSAA